MYLDISKLTANLNSSLNSFILADYKASTPLNKTFTLGKFLKLLFSIQ